MIENNREPLYHHYHKKMISYLDGSLSAEDKSEFEAFVRIHPEFEAQIKHKEDELLLLKSLIPAAHSSRRTVESLENEMKLYIFNLLKEEPKGLWDRLKISWEDWINR